VSTERHEIEPPAKGGFPWRLALLLLLLLYVIVLVALNAKSVKVNFVFFSTRASLVVVIVLSIALGFLAGFLFDTLRDRRKRAL
jgi:uncharacterized integral membrane protein